MTKAVERYRLRQQAQLPGEIVEEYVAALRIMAKTCKCEGQTEDLICDPLVEKTSTKEVREGLLLEPELRLDAALVFTMQVAQALHESQLLTQDKNDPSISQVAAHTIYFAKSSKQGQKCHKTESLAHSADDTLCPARTKTCKSAAHVVILHPATTKITACLNAKGLVNIEGVQGIQY